METARAGVPCVPADGEVQISLPQRAVRGAGVGVSGRSRIFQPVASRVSSPASALQECHIPCVRAKGMIDIFPLLKGQLVSGWAGWPWKGDLGALRPPAAGPGCRNCLCTALGMCAGP